MSGFSRPSCQAKTPPLATTERGKLVVQEAVHEVDAVAHPLVGDAAREVLVEAELEVQPRDRTDGRACRAASGASPCRSSRSCATSSRPRQRGPVVVPDRSRPCSRRRARRRLDELAGRDLVGLAAVLGADLDDALRAQDGVAGGLGLGQVVRPSASRSRRPCPPRPPPSGCGRSAGSPAVEISTASTSFSASRSSMYWNERGARP